MNTTGAIGAISAINGAGTNNAAADATDAADTTDATDAINAKCLLASNPRTVVALGETHKWRRQVGWHLEAKTVVDEQEFESFSRLPLPPPTVAPWRRVGRGWGIALSLQGESH